MKNESSNKTRTNENTATELNTELQKMKSEDKVNDCDILELDYISLIIELLHKISNKKYLRRIYLFVKGFLEQGQ